MTWQDISTAPRDGTIEGESVAPLMHPSTSLAIADRIMDCIERIRRVDPVSPGVVSQFRLKYEGGVYDIAIRKAGSEPLPSPPEGR